MKDTDNISNYQLNQEILKKKMRPKKILEAKFEARPIFEARPKFGLMAK